MARHAQSHYRPIIEPGLEETRPEITLFKGQKMKSKKLILTMILLYCGIANAMGPTVSFMTEQIASVDKGNSLSVEVGYMLGIDAGLEPYIGTEWWPRTDEAPSVLILGVRNHFKDILDPNSVIPFIPDLMLSVLNEDIEMKPYIGIRFSANLVDKDGGVMSIPAGILVKTSPDSNSALRFEARYSDTFGDLAVIPDGRIDLYMGIYIPF